MKLVDMKLSTEEAKEMAGGVAPEAEDLPRYSYGTCLYLNDELLKKLGVKDLPPVGTKFVLMAEAEVTGTSSRQNLKGDAESHVDIQITSMGMENPSKSQAEALYGKGE